MAYGLVPKPEILTNPEMLYVAIGILGATVMPHNVSVLLDPGNWGLHRLRCGLLDAVVLGTNCSRRRASTAVSLA